jgi:hypothetical protein
VSFNPYSSFEAFLAHYRALKTAQKLAPEERTRLSEIERQVEPLRTDLGVLLDSYSAGREPAGAEARKRERIERRLRRELIARGVISG